MDEPHQYSHDVDWSLIKSLRNIGVRLLKDNSLERGPLKAIKQSRGQLDRYRFWQTTSHHWRMQNNLLKDVKLPHTLYEYPTDTIHNFEKHANHRIGSKNLKNNGWLVNDQMVEISYHINKQGFRHDGTQPDYLTEQGGVIYIGDSHTMGVGVPIEQSWTYIAHNQCEYTKGLRYLNMGCPGFGIDSFYRLLKYYIEILKPNLVVMSYPWQSTRTELFDPDTNAWESVTINKESRSKLKGEDNNLKLFHTGSCYARWYKSLDAIKWLCYTYGSELYAIEEDMSEIDASLQNISNKFIHQVDDDDWARDLVHYGRRTHLHNGNVLDQALTYIFEKDE